MTRGEMAGVFVGLFMWEFFPDIVLVATVIRLWWVGIAWIIKTSDEVLTNPRT